jgi:hypothetical protein
MEHGHVSFRFLGIFFGFFFEIAKTLVFVGLMAERGQGSGIKFRKFGGKVSIFFI